MKFSSQQIKRLLMALVGVALSGVCVGIFKTADLGADPFTVFVTGIGNLFHLSYGTMYLILTGLLLVAVFFIDRRYIHIATLFNLVGVGYIADFTISVFQKVYLPQSFPEQLVMLVIGVIVLCVASSLYFIADLGVSAYDAMALILAKKTPVPFRICRIGTDVICTAVGFFCKAKIGIGTVFTALFMGPIIQWCNIHISVPLLYGKDAIQKKPKDIASGAAPASPSPINHQSAIGVE